MNLLFFDIECANCFQGNGKICSFGYVLCNSDFQIIKQADLLINPKSKFHLGASCGANDIELGYAQEMFMAQPYFDAFYEEIKDILQAPDQICFGHSVNNDLNFITSECRRYKMPYINIKAYDSQIIYKFLTNGTCESGLSKICEIYNIQVTDLHRSDYDAYLTMLIVKKMCEERNINIQELLQLCPNCFYDVKDGMLTNHYATINPSKRLYDFAKHIRVDSELQLNENVFEKYFCFNQNFELNNYKKALFLVKRIRQLGGFYCNKIKKSDYFLNIDKECARSEQIENLQDEGLDIKILTEQNACSILEVNWRDYVNSEMMSITKLKEINKKQK